MHSSVGDSGGSGQYIILLLELFNFYFRHWNRELTRTERGLKPRLWFALFQTFKWILILHIVLYYLMVFLLLLHTLSVDPHLSELIGSWISQIIKKCGYLKPLHLCTELHSNTLINF